ncbi:hypothetical protein KBD08_01535 [Candidatus Babeliales bacterium]|nr:hypothetical protein [Candidatus Babeliales bacterium]
MFSIKKTSFIIATLFAFNGATNCSNNTVSSDAVHSCYEGHDSAFKFLEYTFIEQVREQVESLTTQVQAGLFSVGTLGFLGYNSVQKDDTTKIGAQTTILVSLVAKFIVYDTYVNYVKNKVQTATLINFLKNWETHRAYIPTQFQDLFDELATAYANSTNKTISAQDVQKVYSIIQHLIEHEFAKRYEKDKIKAADTLNLTKTITDIAKNSFGK